MASACINTIGLSPHTYAWFNPRLSLGRREDASNAITSPVKDSDLPQESDPKDFDGFQFRLDDPAMMLPADELFSDGKLVPLQFSLIRLQEAATSTTAGVSSPDTSRDDTDPYLLSPRAPRCSSRWKELLGFGKTNNIGKQADTQGRTSLAACSHSRSIRQFLHRSSKSANDYLPLLKDADQECVSRPSLSSGHDLEEPPPRLSLDSDRPGKVKINPRPKSRMEGRCRSRSSIRGVSLDSPRMNSSGKIVFQSLERSSSSPSSLNGMKQSRGMERSYSGNVRVRPVLNVVGGSSAVFGFPIFSSQQKREGRGQRLNAGKGRTD